MTRGRSTERVKKRPMQRVSIRAALFAGVADVIGSFALNAVLIGIIGALVVKTGPAVNGQNVIDAFRSPGVWALQYVTGGLVSIAAGYYAARLAGHDLVLNGAASAWLWVTLGIVAMIAARGASLFELAMLPASPLLGALGGYFRLRHLAARAAA